MVYRDYGPPGGGGIWSRRKERKEYFAKLRAKGLLENLGFKICEEPFAEKYEAKYTAWLEYAKKIVNKSGRQETCGILETSIESSS